MGTANRGNDATLAEIQGRDVKRKGFQLPSITIMHEPDHVTERVGEWAKRLFSPHLPLAHSPTLSAPYGRHTSHTLPTSSGPAVSVFWPGTQQEGITSPVSRA